MEAAEYKLCEAKSVTVIRWRAESEIMGVVISVTFCDRMEGNDSQENVKGKTELNLQQ